MNLLYHSLAFYLLLASPTSTSAAASSPKESPAPQPCTIRSATTHAFFDLNPLHIESPAERESKSTKSSKNARDYSWNATGWGLDYNFTMNFCGPVVEELKGVVGVEEARWANVSAFYRVGKDVVSIG